MNNLRGLSEFDPEWMRDGCYAFACRRAVAMGLLNGDDFTLTDKFHEIASKLSDDPVDEVRP